MFVRVKHVRANGRSYQYLQVVENFRADGRVRQRILGSLGRLDQLLASGDLERVIAQLVERCPSVRLLRAEQSGALAVQSDRSWGPVLVFDRLWEELGLKALLPKLVRGVDFDFERMVFAQVLQRFCEPGSDLRGSKWIATVHEPAFAGLRLPHFYRSLGRLWKHKEHIEEALYLRGRDLFNADLDLAFFDTTSTYFEGNQLKGWAKLGKSKDHRPDHLQLVIGVVMRRDGLPVACEVWPGNTADMTTLVPIVEALRKRFRIRKVVLVCDRGMVSAKNLAAVEKAGFQYIVGMKMRNLVEVRDEVLGRAGRYHEVSDNLRVKEVHVEERRYVVCFNPDEARKDRLDREATLEKIRQKLERGGVKQLINNRGYKRYLEVERGSATIDLTRVREDERYDGKYVLRTTTELPADEVATAYKHLTWIERLWRELKDVVELRPIFHWRRRDNVKGHIFVCFLALYLAALLRRKLAEAQLEVQWDEAMRDLAAMRAVIVELGGEQYLLRSPLQGVAGKIFAAVGIKPPPLAQPASAANPEV
jgi:Transposase DDE domain